MEPGSRSTFRGIRRSRVVAVVLVFAALVAAFVWIRPILLIAYAGSGLDPRIPADERVAPSIDPELLAHTRLYDKKVYAVGRVHCAVGWGLANIVFVEGDDGVIVVDTGENVEQATAVLAQIRAVTPKPIAAVILTHHHADHVLGTSVFAGGADASAASIPIIAHDSLLDRYASENGTLAELQTARSAHMYGLALGPADREGANDGIGPFITRGSPGFVAPNRTFAEQLDLTIAGVRMRMIHVPSEAESEIAIHLPDDRVLLSAEVVQDHTFPNVYTIRGARFRDPAAWVKSLDALRAFDADAMVLQHGPPVNGHDEVQRVLVTYRDQIQFVHDQTIRWMNRGLGPVEIAKTLRLPPHLAAARPWSEPFYGTTMQAARAVYAGNEGWFEGDPVDLDPTPPVQHATKMIALMGGRDAVMNAARRAFASGEHQFTAELTTFLVRVDTKDMDARHLKAAAFRKLGYAQKNASWRNYYLVSAMELDDQIPEALYLHEASRVLGEAMRALPASNQVEALPPRLKAEETLEDDVILGVRFVDAGESFALHLRRGVLEVARGEAVSPAFSLRVTRAAMGAFLAGGTFEDATREGMEVSGDAARARWFFGRFEVPFTHKPEVVVR